MKLKRASCIFQVVFLLLTFGAVTFYFQYSESRVSGRNSFSGTQKEDSTPLPMSEEESGDEKTSGEEEQQDEDRAFHHHHFVISNATAFKLRSVTQVILDFKEIHFEIVTPPPQA